MPGVVDADVLVGRRLSTGARITPHNPKQSGIVACAARPRCHPIRVIARQLLLHQVEDELGDDRGVAVFRKVLWDGAVIEITPMRQHILLVVFLEQDVTCILLVLQDVADVYRRPVGSPSVRLDAVSRKPRADLPEGFAVKELTVDPADDCGLLFIDYALSGEVGGIPQHILRIVDAAALLEPVLYAELDVL